MNKRLALMTAALALSVGCGTSGLPTNTGPGPAQCLRDEPASGSFRGGENVGGYEGNLLPGTFRGLASEAQVTGAITRIRNSADWACFQKFYGGAVRKWQELTR